MRKALAATLAACTLGFASGGVLAVECPAITSIGAWEDLGSCTQGDKTWTLNSTDLGFPITVLFINPSENSHGMVLGGFDTTDAPGTWNINYTISVTAPDHYISAMFAEADNPGWRFASHQGRHRRRNIYAGGNQRNSGCRVFQARS